MRASRGAVFAVLALAVALGGCFDRDLTDVRPRVQTGVDIRVEQVGIIRVDIVVLVDNSGSMREEQIALTQRFPELIAELIDPGDEDGDTHADHPPVEDLNIGVIDSDMGTAGFTVSTCLNSDRGDDGCFRNTPAPGMGCAATYSTFLYRNPTNAATYSAEQMAQDFTCIATLGTNGCGFEQQLKAMRKAVTENTLTGGCNAGFLRGDSLVALIFVTDENDCSGRPENPELFDPTRNADLGHLNIRCFLHPEFVQDIGEYVDAFDDLRPDDPARLVLGFLIGVPPDAPACIGSGEMLEGCLGVPAMNEMINPAQPTELVPSCNTSMGLAFPPKRFIQIAQAFGARAIVDSICKDDWRGAIKGITDKLVERLPSTCFPRELEFDRDPADETEDVSPLLCMANCKVIETLSDARACEPDSSCLQEWCPPATAEDIANMPACTDPGGAVCEPLKRDLGTIVMPSGLERRQCLVRQASRGYAGDRCTIPPLDEGWYYQPPDWSEDGCPQVVFTLLSGGSLIEVGSTADLRCLSFLCPEDQSCGPSTAPTAICCKEDEVCDPPMPRLESGTCVPRD